MSGHDFVYKITIGIAVVILSVSATNQKNEIQDLKQQDQDTINLIGERIDVMQEQAELFTLMTDNLKIVEDQYTALMKQLEAQNG